MGRAISLLAGYGAFELKRAYRKNIFTGMLVASILHLAVIGGIVLISYLSSKPPKAVGTIVWTTADLGAPPTLSGKDIPIRVAAPERALPSVGVPTPVPDDEAPEEVEMATMDDLAAMAASLPVIDLDDTGDKNIIIENLEDLLPSPDEYVFYEEYPQKIEDIKPEFPELAWRAGITGTVWVKALVDKEGKVRDVIIVRDSGAKAGFEEASVEAAMNTTWKPAISNGHPIAVWVTYKYDFIFKGD